MNVRFHMIILLLLALSNSLLGLSILLIGPHKHITLVTEFLGLSRHFSDSFLNSVAAIVLFVSGFLSFVAMRDKRFIPVLAYLLIMIAVFPLLALGADSMWIKSLGGFPVIGSGQGVIKYFALLSIGCLLLARELPNKTRAWLSIFPVLLVLLWIGGMKFTEIEARGIQDLVDTSPLMSWMYALWDVQTTSNLIGVYDLVAVLLLIVAIYWYRLVPVAVAMSGAVFIVTQTFLVSFDGALSAQTLLTTTGHFLIKDLWFLTNLLFFVDAVKMEGGSSAKA